MHQNISEVAILSTHNKFNAMENNDSVMQMRGSPAGSYVHEEQHPAMTNLKIAVMSWGEKISLTSRGIKILPLYSQTHRTAKFMKTSKITIYFSEMQHLWICSCTFHSLSTCLIAARILLRISRDLFVVFLRNCHAVAHLLLFCVFFFFCLYSMYDMEEYDDTRCCRGIEEFWSVGCAPSVRCSSPAIGSQHLH